MSRTENLKAALDKAEKCPPEVLIKCAAAHEAVIYLVDQCLQNIFLQNMKVGQKEIEYWKSTGLLNGYLLTAFNRMVLYPPKEWRPEAVKEGEEVT